MINFFLFFLHVSVLTLLLLAVHCIWAYHLPCDNVFKVDCARTEPYSLHPHETDCTLYYVCYDFPEPLIKSCPEGEIFDIPSKTCTADGTCNRCTSTICAESPTCSVYDFDVLKPYPNNCSVYIHCDAGIMYMESCPIGLEFSPMELQCMTPDTANCPTCGGKIRVVRELRAACPPTPNCGIFDDGIKKVYPPDCTKYILCSAGSSSIQSCPLGQEFSPTQKVCTSPALALCPVCGGVDTTTTSPPTTTTVTAEPTTENSTEPSTTPAPVTLPIEYNTTIIPTTIPETIPTTQAPPICPVTPTCGTFDDNIKKPYPPDCTKYVFCQFGSASIQSCPVGQEFSPTQKRCMSPELALCPYCVVGQATTTTTSTSTTTPSTTTTPTTTPVPLPPCDPTPTCTVDEYGVLKTYPPDCTKYIYCNTLGDAEIRVCPRVTYFSEIEKGCISDSTVCVYCSTSTPAP
jgi:hypothetical protein